MRRRISLKPTIYDTIDSACCYAVFSGDVISRAGVDFVSVV
jgi:hypothetical protein